MAANWQAETQKGLPVLRCQVTASLVKAAWEREGHGHSLLLGARGLLLRFAQPTRPLRQGRASWFSPECASLRVIFNYVI